MKVHFKVKIKLKQAAAIAAGGEIWYTVTEPRSEIKEENVAGGGLKRVNRGYLRNYSGFYLRGVINIPAT